ncbi:hypothetical protein JCM19237_2628 [Photobacterium aphoticum]|uniref:ABC transporter ATP-binding protein n=1 Tax=Photobacterium aphoticum TaxID=754436 RepID=A0A090RG68_9GAMM|nr:hypothetical protein JCM19237_2628 [Photobacterium aphoticum]
MSAQGIEVLSMRNKANRLEELFVALVTNETSTHANSVSEKGTSEIDTNSEVKDDDTKGARS